MKCCPLMLGLVGSWVSVQEYGWQQRPRQSGVAGAGFVGKEQLCAGQLEYYHLPCTEAVSGKNWSPAEENNLSMWQGHDRDAMGRRRSHR